MQSKRFRAAFPFDLHSQKHHLKNGENQNTSENPRQDLSGEFSGLSDTRHRLRCHLFQDNKFHTEEEEDASFEFSLWQYHLHLLKNQTE